MRFSGPGVRQASAQAAFLSDPEICTKEVLQQILEAGRVWLTTKKPSWWRDEIPDVSDVGILQALTAAQMNFCHICSCWPGEPNEAFLLFSLQQCVNPVNVGDKDFLTNDDRSPTQVIRILRDLVISLTGKVERQGEDD